MEFVLERNLRAAPAAVWPYVTEPDRMNEWSRARVEGVPAGAASYAKVGARRRVRVPLAGISIALDEVIEEVEYPSRLVYRVEGATVPVRSHRGEIRLDECPTGTRLRWAVQAKFPVPLIGRLARRHLTRELGRSLDALRSLIDESSMPTVDEVIARIDARLRELTLKGDGRRRFLRMYGVFQGALGQAVVEGDFLDPSWAEEMCQRMAEYHFEAQRVYDDDPDACLEPWRYSFDRARSGSTNLLQDMLFGMNAHINYDLPLAAYDTLVAFGDLDELREAPKSSQELRLAFDANLRRRYFDFLQVNHIAWKTIPVIQDVMCSEFSRLLGLANVASFRYSKRVVEKLICEHRDRAWSHTLLLATAAGPIERESLTSFISDFTMARAALVDRLTVNPLRLARAMRRRNRQEQALLRRHVELLVDHLRRPVTAKAARRALAEYGRQIHPLLEEMVPTGAIDPALRDEILSVMAETPSPSVAAALCRHWETAPGEGRPAIRLLASMRRAGVRVKVPRTLLLDALAREAVQARSLAESAQSLDGQEGDALLQETLRRRLEDVIRAMVELVTVLHPDRAFAATVERTDTGTLEHLIDQMRRALPRSIRPTILQLLQPSDGASRVARLEALAQGDDPWLQACALHRIGERRIVELTPIVERLTSSDSDLVRETALCTHRQLVDPVAEGETSPMLSMIEKVLYLKNVELFQAILAEDLVEVARVAEERRFKRGDELISEGVPGEELFVIIEGAVDVVAGGDKRLARLEAKSVIGEMAILSEAPTSAACVAATDGRALRIRRTNFLRFLLEYPEIAIGLINVLSVRVRQTSAQVPAAAGER